MTDIQQLDGTMRLFMGVYSYSLRTLQIFRPQLDIIGLVCSNIFCRLDQGVMEHINFCRSTIHSSCENDCRVALIK